MFLLALCAFDGIALVVAIAVAWRLPYRGSWRELASLAVACALLFLAVTLSTMSSGGFAVMRGWAHTACCVAMPAVMVRAVRLRRLAPRLASALAFLATSGEGLYVWAREIEPRRLEVTTATVVSPRLAALTQPVRVACVADLQTDAITSYEVAVFDRLVELQPDVVLFLGDYLQLPAAECAAQLPALHAQLRRLQPRLGMFAVDGDVDGAAGGVDALFAGTSVQVLVDAHAALPNVPIDVHGLSRMRSRAPLLDAGLVRRLGGERFPIVLGHAPDFMLSVLRGGLRAEALMVAGHTHGGQVQVPGFGPLVTLSSVPRWLAGGGVFQQQGAWLVCSRGIGMERGLAPQVRFCCRPQLIVLELRGG